jgi:predicted house-cleaning noncanonical NTP pyrophosphatase (MazG superfamily)
MVEKTYNKLIRDGIPQIIKQNGGQPVVRIMEQEEFVRELKNKLIEEANEVATATNREELVNELADVKEVINTLCAATEIIDREIEVVRIAKADQRGSFQDKLMLEKVEE